MHTIIEKSLKGSFTYQEYRSFVTHLAKQNKTTGHEQREDLIHYTQLNETRLHRLDKTIQVVDEVKTVLQNLSKEYIWLVISESWCGDAAQILPVINKMAESRNLGTGKIDLRIVLRDDNDDLMNLFLTNGTKSIPKLIILDKNTLKVLGDFGPRPKGAVQLILDYKKEHGIVDEVAKIELQKWYLNDKGLSTQREIVELIR
jgi:hypothetical protein